MVEALGPLARRVTLRTDAPLAWICQSSRKRLTFSENLRRKTPGDAAFFHDLDEHFARKRATTAATSTDS